ncbi:ankyrin repeat domain-containing protein [Flavobacterium bizetiae]|uniref:ankyrin repeat domain-containing protein n=1 Tax=Flavobacterium bizetiae TaxID=2704140 RepID=UPI0037575A4E
MKHLFVLIASLQFFTNTSFSQSSQCNNLLNFIMLDNYSQSKKIISKPNFDLNCISESGNSPLGLAASRGNFELVKYLLRKGADPNLKQIGKYAIGKTPLFDATYIYDQELEPNLSVKRTIKKYDYRIKDEIVKLLINHNADVHIIDDNGTTLLMVASIFNRKQIIHLYLKKGININAQDNFGNTALMYAVINNHADTIQLLLKAGADINIKNNKGEIALDIANERKHLNIVTFLSVLKI